MLHAFVRDGARACHAVIRGGRCCRRWIPHQISIRFIGK